jgi:pilus assembly protein Flp/PilA
LDAIRSFFRTLRRDQGGATAIEYGLIVALISVAAIGAMSSMGGGNNGMWTRISNNVSNAMN